MYYRRIGMQDRFYYLNNLHQSGVLGSAWVKIDQHSRISLDYSLDNDFFLFVPDIKTLKCSVWDFGGNIEDAIQREQSCQIDASARSRVHRDRSSASATGSSSRSGHR